MSSHSNYYTQFTAFDNSVQHYCPIRLFYVFVWAVSPIIMSSCIKPNTDYMESDLTCLKYLCCTEESKLIRQGTAPFICFIVETTIMTIIIVIVMAISLLVLCKNYLRRSFNCCNKPPLHLGAITVLQNVTKKKCVYVCLQGRPRTLITPLIWTMWSCLVCHWPSTLGCMHTLGGRYGPHAHTHAHAYMLTIPVVKHHFLNHWRLEVIQ